MRKKTVLIITDGIGYNKSCKYNAFCQANKPTYDMLFEKYPHSLIKTSGLSVGLPQGQMGNSEVGHLSIGSGRVLYQNLVKISKAIEDNTLKDNKNIKKLFDNSNDIHILGLVSDGGVHSHIDHIIALSMIAKKSNKKVFIHAITDGRDVSPHSGLDFLKKLKSIEDDKITIATVSGRFYAMDRDSRWDRIKKAYECIVEGENKSSDSIEKFIEKSYKDNITDEFLMPTSFNEYKGFSKGDGVIFANFRSDRMREISCAIGCKEFRYFNRSRGFFQVLTMTEYDKNIKFDTIFETDIPKNILAEIISKNGLRQFHTAETEKYAHVTFFFNGGVEKPFENETRVLIPSPKVKTYDQKPSMSAIEVCDTVLKAMDEEYEFIVVNFANGDMVGHTGVYEAGIKAVEVVDSQIGKIIQKSKEKEYSIILTSDHGNVEQMRDENGKILTNHTTFDVYCFVIDDEVKKINDGQLSNIAPTVLKLMGLDIPKEMDKPLF